MLFNSFKWKHFVGEIILLNVRWYLKYPLSYRNLEEMMAERGVKVDHTTIMRWVHQYSPEIEQKVRRYLRPTNDSWRVDETYIKVKGEWKYFYRAVDSVVLQKFYSHTLWLYLLSLCTIFWVKIIINFPNCEVFH